MKTKPLLICVVGPTAIGKTSMAIKLAQGFNTEVISADSRQFYKEMSIGTAVPTLDELEAVPHHFIKNKSIFEDYSVGDFEKDALELLDQKFYSNTFEEDFKIMVMVGGSGLYVDAVVKGLDKFPNVPDEIRESLNSELEKFGIEHLQKQLAKVDPAYYDKVDIHNPHRVIRALEVFYASNQPYSSFLNRTPTERSFDTVFIGLSANREVVYDRINKRVDIMISEGLIEEAQKLLPYRDQNALQTVGYRELFDYFDGKTSKEDAISEIKKNTRRFAKRQNTWFKKNSEIHWFDYQAEVEEIIDFIKRKNAY